MEPRTIILLVIGALMIATATFMFIGTHAHGTHPPNGLCVFDYDQTLTRLIEPKVTEKNCGGHLPMDLYWSDGSQRQYAAVYAAGAVEACKLNNMRIGLASSAGCPPSPDEDPWMRSRVGLLEKLGFPRDVAPGDGLAGPAFRCSGTDKDKHAMVSALQDYYHVSAQHTVFFDDQTFFLQNVGSQAHTVLALTKLPASACSSDELICDAWCGVTKEQVEQGLRKALGRQPLMPDNRTAVKPNVALRSEVIAPSKADRTAQTGAIMLCAICGSAVALAALRLATRKQDQSGSYQTM